VVVGSTWRVNAVIISGVLAAILLANALAARSRWPSWIGFAGVGISCPALYGIAPAWFGSLVYPLKAALVGGMTALPLFFSGLIFARSLARAGRKDRALGANLLGALAGGLL